MQSNKSLWFPFLHKEKILLIFIVFILINISIYTTFQNSIFSYANYDVNYPNAGLEFFYYIYCIGVNPFFFILLMLLLPNLVSYDFLNMHQNHHAYMIEKRINKKQYYFDIFKKNILMTFIVMLVIQGLMALIIHFFYLPIHFNMMNYPIDYYCTTQVLAHNELISFIFFLIFTALGYSIVSSLVFSLQIIITNKYIYRCFGVIFGILLVLIPALIQGYLPIPEAAFLLQINNLVAIGMENVRVNPFGLSNLSLYFISALLYSLLSIICFEIFIKRRQIND